MIAPHQATVTRLELACELGVHPVTLSNLTSRTPALRAAKITRGLYSVQRLRDAGYLPQPVPSEAQS